MAIEKEVFYYDPAGSLSNDGLSEATARTRHSWAYDFQYEDGISPEIPIELRFKAGGRYHFAFTQEREDAGYEPRKYTLTRYGEGKNPVIDLGKRIVSWTEHAPNIWKTHLLNDTHYIGYKAFTLQNNYNVGYLYVDGKIYGDTKGSIDSLTSQWQYYVDKTPGSTVNGTWVPNPNRGMLYVYSVSQPVAVIVATDEQAIKGYKGMTLDGVDMAFCGGNGFNVDNRAYNNTNATDIIVRNSYAEYIGGSYLTGNTKYGNAYQVFGGGKNILFQNVKAYEIYDTPFTVQEAGLYDNVVFDGYESDKTAQGPEVWSKSNMGYRGVRFRNGIIRNAGACSLFPYRRQDTNPLDQLMGVGYMSYINEMPYETDLVIETTQFILPKLGLMSISKNGWRPTTRNNTITLLGGQEICPNAYGQLYNSAWVNTTEGIAAFQAATGMETGSTWLTANATPPDELTTFRIRLGRIVSVNEPQPEQPIELDGLMQFNTINALQSDNSDNNYVEWFDYSTPPSNDQLRDTPTSDGKKNLIKPYRCEFHFTREQHARVNKIDAYDGFGGGGNVYITFHLVFWDGTEIRDIGRFNAGAVSKYVDIYNNPLQDKDVKMIYTENPGGAIYWTKLRFYGKHYEYVPKSGVYPTPDLIDMNGLNAFTYNYNTLAKAQERLPGVGYLRDYMNWKWIEEFRGYYNFNPLGFGGFKHDDTLTFAKNLGTKVVQNIKEIPYRYEATYPTNQRNKENAYLPYKGNLGVFANQAAFPTNGATENVTFLDSDGVAQKYFPYTLDQPTYFLADDTDFVYRWDGTQYVQLTENIPNVYFSINTTTYKFQSYFNELALADRENPFSFQELAELTYQIVARYGKNKNLPSGSVKSLDGLTGMNLIYAIELTNEANAWWMDIKRYMNGPMLMALMSACYDGHMGVMPGFVGAKAADPTMKVAMGGIVSANPRFAKSALEWCAKHRGYNADGSVNVPYDIFKVHVYTNSTGIEQYASGDRYGLPADMVPAALESIKQIKDMHLEYGIRNMEVHIGEGGYDVSPRSPQGVREIKDAQGNVIWNAWHVKGFWVVRDMFAWATTPLDSHQRYMMEDSFYNADPINTPGVYGSSGDFNRGDQNTSTTPFGPNQARYSALYPRQVALAFPRFKSKVINFDPRVYELTGQDGSKAYMTVIPDIVGRKGSYSLSLPNVTSVTKYTLQPTGNSMATEIIPVENNSLTVEVSEVPVIYKINQ